MLENKIKVQKLESGQQLGVRFSTLVENETIWTCIGIQKFEKKFQLYICVINDSNIIQELFEKEILTNFNSLDETLNYTKVNFLIGIEDINPLKGQKIFVPTLCEDSDT